MPARAGNVRISLDLRILAITRLRSVAPILATIAFLRVGQANESGREEEDLFASVWVARLDEEEVRELADRAKALLDLALGSYRIQRGLDHELAIHWQGRANFAARLLGCLVVRLPIEGARRVLESAITYFKRGEDGHQLIQESFLFLFERAGRSLPIDQRISFLVELISIPLRNDPQSGLWPDPALDLQTSAHFPDRKTFEPAYTTTVRHLVGAAKGTSEFARKRALLRLAILHDLRLLDANENRALADALWALIGERGLPWNDAFSDEHLLRLPEREHGEALRAWRRGYLSAESSDPFDIADAMRKSDVFKMVAGRLRAVTSAAMSTRGGSPRFSLEASEAALLARRLLALLSRDSRTKPGSHSASIGRASRCWRNMPSPRPPSPT